MLNKAKRTIIKFIWVHFNNSVQIPTFKKWIELNWAFIFIIRIHSYKLPSVEFLLILWLILSIANLFKLISKKIEMTKGIRLEIKYTAAFFIIFILIIKLIRGVRIMKNKCITGTKAKVNNFSVIVLCFE